MIDTRKLTPAQIRHAAIQAVIREVGVVGLVRLLRDELPSNGNYMMDRDVILPHFESVDDLLDAIAREGASKVSSDPQDRD